MEVGKEKDVGLERVLLAVVEIVHNDVGMGD